MRGTAKLKAPVVMVNRLFKLTSTYWTACLGMAQSTIQMQKRGTR